jgi:hypothetical protein
MLNALKESTAMRVELVREDKIAERFRAVKTDAPKFIVAAPYWSGNAIELLGLRPGQKGRVLCNLAHDACDPNVIELLVGMRGVAVRTHSDLHAKIYAAGSVAIVGSSNATGRGLQADGWIEANTLVDSAEFARGIWGMFDSIWTSRLALKVGPELIAEAKDRWRNRPPPPIGTANTVFSAFSRSPDAFKSVYVCAWTKDLTRAGKRCLQTFQSSARPSADGLSLRDIRNSWGYQFNNQVPAGIEWIIDLDCSNRAKPEVLGSSKVQGFRLPVDKKGDDDVTVTVRGPIKLPWHHASLSIPPEEKRILTSNADKILRHTDANGLVAFSKVANLIGAG